MKWSQKLHHYNVNQSPEDMSTDNSRNTLYIKYRLTSNNGQIYNINVSIMKQPMSQILEKQEACYELMLYVNTS
jgi:hypothetical protein